MGRKKVKVKTARVNWKKAYFALVSNTERLEQIIRQQDNFINQQNAEIETMKTDMLEAWDGVSDLEILHQLLPALRDFLHGQSRLRSVDRTASMMEVDPRLQAPDLTDEGKRP